MVARDVTWETRKVLSRSMIQIQFVQDFSRLDMRLPGSLRHSSTRRTRGVS